MLTSARGLFIITQDLLLLAHFTVACLVTFPLSGSEAVVDFVLIQTSVFFVCNS